MTKSIDWGDGSGDKLTLEYSSATGNQAITISSDPNGTSSSRTKTVTFATSVGGASKSISVTQKAFEKKEYTVTLYPSAFVSGSYSSISNQNNPVGKGSASTSYSQIYLNTGSRATSNLIYSFDTSSIPADAEIVSVTCAAKAYISQTNSSRIATRQIQLYSGSTAKGSAYTISNSTTAFNMTPGTWNRSEMDDMRIMINVARGTSSTTSNYYVRFYGATLTIKYKA